MVNVTKDYLETKYGKKYVDILMDCIWGEADVQIHKDTIYRLEKEMIENGLELDSVKLSLRDTDIKEQIYEYLGKSNREHYISLVISGYRYPRISSIIGDIWSDYKVEIIPAIKRIKAAPFYNELIIIAY